MNEADLAKCPCYSSIYYKTEDVEEIFCVKHGIVDQGDGVVIEAKIKDIENIKKEKKILREEAAKKKIIMRKKKLVEELNKYGLVLRSDSRLCAKYINGEKIDYTLEGVVERMCQMKYLYDYCQMNKYYREAYEFHCEEYRMGYIPDVRVSDHAEMMALKAHGGYPEKWPWLVDNTIDNKVVKVDESKNVDIIKAKRGRPKKIKPVVESDVDKLVEKVEMIEIVSKPVKRGRPKKIKPVVESNVDKLIEKVEMVEIVAKPVRRGRPKKIKVVE